MGHWFDDMEENIPYLEPEQNDHQQERDQEDIPVPNQQDNNHYYHETEETPYPQDHHHEPMDVEEVPVQLYCITPTTIPRCVKNANSCQDQNIPVNLIDDDFQKITIIIRNKTRRLSSLLSRDKFVRMSR